MARDSEEPAAQIKTRQPEGDRVSSPVRPKSSQASSQKPKKKKPTARSQAQEPQQSISEAGAPETPPRTASGLSSSFATSGKLTTPHQESRSTKTPATDSQRDRNNNKGKLRHPSTLKDAIHQGDAQGSSYDVSATPAKPMQAYAGPTFHASPAPSSLPIPRMFSKSVPQVNDKTASLKAMLHDELSEDSSFSGDGSPTLRNSTMAGNERARDVSPLDIFFKADKEERAQRASSTEPSNSLQTPSHNRRAQSSSPVSGNGMPPPQPHGGGMFPLESDGEVFGSRPSSSAANPSLQNDSAAQAKAKTEALKQLLRFTPSPGPASAARLPEQRSSSRPFAPPSYERRLPSLESGDRDSMDIHGRPGRFQTPPAAQPYTRPLHELNSNTPGQRPSSQSSVAFTDYRPPSGHYPQRVPMPGRSASSRDGPQFSAEDALKASAGNTPGASASTAEMEDQLRKMLKLDGFSSSGVRP